MSRRFNWLTRLVQQAVLDQDVFGLSENNITTFQKEITVNADNRVRLPMGELPGPRAFQFGTSAEKADQLMEWFNRQAQRGILQRGTREQLGTGLRPAWTNLYIEDTYKRGVQRARYEMGRAGYAVPSIEASGGIGVAMAVPGHVDRVGIAYSRTFQELRGITATMDTQISRVLAQGLADGDGPRLLARKLVKTITGPVGNLDLTDTLGRFMPAKRRAIILARTETIRAHHQGMIQEYRNWGVAGVTVQAEWSTAGDDRVCPDCLAMEGRIFTLDQISNLIPLHAQCRCIALPTMPGALGPAL